MAGVLPATLRVALRSKIVLCSASCLDKNPAFAIHGYGVRRAETVLRLFPPHPADFVNFRRLPPEGGNILYLFIIFQQFTETLCFGTPAGMP